MNKHLREMVQVALGTLYTLLLFAAIAGCASAPSFPDALGAAYLAVDTAAVTAHEACRNDAPGGECAPGSAITTQQKDDVRMALEHALDTLDDARLLYAMGDIEQAGDRLQAARALLRAVEDMLTRAEQ